MPRKGKLQYVQSTPRSVPTIPISSESAYVQAAAATIHPISSIRCDRRRARAVMRRDSRKLRGRPPLSLLICGGHHLAHANGGSPFPLPLPGDRHYPTGHKPDLFLPLRDVNLVCRTSKYSKGSLEKLLCGVVRTVVLCWEIEKFTQRVLFPINENSPFHNGKVGLPARNSGTNTFWQSTLSPYRTCM